MTHPPREYGSVVTPQSITVHFLDGTVLTWTKDMPQFAEAAKLLKEKASAADIRALMDMKAQVEEALADGALDGNEDFQIKGNDLYYKEHLVPARLAKNILLLRKQGMGIDRLLNFYRKVEQTQFRSAYEGLYDFIEATATPLTEDGNMILFKSVRPDFKDWHSNTFDNSPGKVVEILPREVEEDRNKGCSAGLHAAGRNYIGSAYGYKDGKLVMVEIDPRHVVSVPYDYNCEKIRVYKYTVLSEVKDGKTMEQFDNMPAVDKGDKIEGVTWAEGTESSDPTPEDVTDSDVKTPDADHDGKCDDCGYALPKDASFCPNCGYAT